MLILIFDTETDGFPRKGKASTHPDQVRLVELGMLLVRFASVDDYACVAEVNLVVDPGEREIPTQASDVHGITTAAAREVGVPLNVAIRTLHALLRKAHVGLAYNTQFDVQVLDHAIAQAYPEASLPWPRRMMDLMPVMTPLCKLPPTAKQKRHYPGKPFKTPKLTEAYQFALERPMQCAHSAIADANATLEVFAWALENDHITLPGLARELDTEEDVPQ